MNRLPWGFAVAVAAAATTTFRIAAGESTPAAALPKEPIVRLALPLGVSTGLPQRITVRGQNLLKTTAARLAGLDPAPTLRLLGSGTAPSGEAGDLVGVGTEWLNLEVLLPEGTPRGTNGSLVLTSPAGESIPFPVFVASGGISAEREPNDDFGNAQDFPNGSLLRGTIANASDLDIYRVELRSGQVLRAELWSARLGAPLNGTLALLDRRGSALMINDDGEGTGRDPVLEFQAMSNGTFLIRVSGVVPRFGDANAYLLDVQVMP